MTLESINPATGQTTETFVEHTAAEVEQILAAAEDTWISWRGVPFAERSRLMTRAAAVLRDRRDEYAETMTREMGKVIGEARAEVEKCAWVCEYYASKAESILADEFIEAGYKKSYVRFDPLGPILAVMPWNFPFWQVFRFAAPALMAGNAGILKHASNVMRCALQIESVFVEAGFPDNLFRSLLIPAGPVGSVIDSPVIRAVTLTGSEPAGSSVAGRAGRALKKTVLELGGSDPFIVLADADLEKAAAAGAVSRLMNCGQSCIAAKRFIVEKSVHERFVALFRGEFEKKTLGDPLDEATDIGPLAREDLLVELEGQVARSLAAGAVVLTGGRRLEREGAFYEPTILTGVRKGMPAFDEELFGPVAAVIEADDADHALVIANDSAYGLGAAIWTADIARAEKMAARIESGAVFINDVVKSDPRLPFGGVKLSGYGRELSHYGIREFVNIKTVAVH
jgi:succinate-semialdehyde dehydrogenase / glutarate-semialdehyde dehydrogenase